MRSLPPVPLIDPPARWSQTIMDKNDKCQRSAYLYQKYHGGQVGHQLDRGSMFHLFAAKATLLLLEEFERNGARTLGEIRGEIDWEARRFRRAPERVEILPTGRRRPAAPVKADVDTVKELLRECYEEHPELTVPLAERDAIREMAYHWAAYPVIDPAKVVAVERKFVYQLPNGHWISGIVDVAEIDGDTLKVRDYKTTFDLPSWGEYASTFQGRFYAVLGVFGQPVMEIPCETCAGIGQVEAYVDHGESCGFVEGPCGPCNGSGVLEILEPPIASHLRYVDVGEVYPRRLLENEGMPVRNMAMTRLQVEDIRDDLCAQTEQLAEAFATGLFPAVDGSHCSRCPARGECPLPETLRSFGGLVNEPEEASEAASWAAMMDAKVKATRKELRAWAKANGGQIRFGRDQIMEFSVQEGWSPVPWDAVEADLERAARYGEPFRLDRHRRPRNSTKFAARTLSPAELEAERENA